MYKATFHEGWQKYFDKLENSIKERVTKKIQKIIQFPHKRHLKKGAKYFVDEVGQHRIIYMLFEENEEVRFFFVGNHKEYEKWYKGFF